MRAAWTPHALSASSLAGEATVSGSGRVPVATDQFPIVMLDAAMLSSAARQEAAHIAAWRRRFAPT
jgi:hypothetical protein